MISQTTATFFTNTLLHADNGIAEKGDLFENQISDMMNFKAAAIVDIVVLDKTGRTLASGNNDWFQSENNFDKLNITDIPNELRTKNQFRNNIHQLEIVSPLRTHGRSFGILVVYFSLEREYSYFATWRIKLYFTALLILVGSIGLSLIVARVLANPIKRLAGEMAKVKDTSYIPELATNRKDEIGYLERGFLDMMLRLKNVNDEKKKSQDLLARAEKKATIGTLAAGLAHEINNPLGGVKTCLKRIKRMPNNQKQTLGYITLMEKALEQIETLLKGLLDYSRPRDPVFNALQLNLIIKSVIEFLDIQTHKKDAIIRTNLNPYLPKIMGDAQQLEQVILNLTLNAIDAVNVGGEIQIDTTYSKKTVFMEIHDNGIGISKEDIPLIFEPFFSTKPKGKGTGLGLAVCQNIIHSHNAVIKVESSPGNGTSFFIEFKSITEEDLLQNHTKTEIYQS